MAGKIFVNYRRDDARDMAARIRDRLAPTFGDANIFMDVDNLFAGQRFDLELDRALAKTRVFLAVIGPRWEEIFKQRLTSGERDHVREEIAGALKRGLVVIPVLIERTPMPRAEGLPDDIRDLVFHQKHVVTHEQFGRDIAGLVHAIRRGRGWTGAATLRWGIPIFAAALVLAGALTYTATDRKPPPDGTSTTGSESGVQPGGGNHQGSGQQEKLPAASHTTIEAKGKTPNGATSPAGTQPPLPGGLTAKILSAGRNCDATSMTVAVELANPSTKPVDVIFVEQMSAVDNAGVAYRLRSYAGTARCKHGYVDDCLGLSGTGVRVPLEQFTRLDPGTSAVITFDLWHSSPKKGTLVTVSADYGYRVIDPGKEDALTDSEKVRTVKKMNAGLLPYPLSTVGCR